MTEPTEPTGPPPARSDRPFWIVNAVVSILALGLLAYLLLIRQGPSTDEATLAFMPAVNASFNAAAAVLLVMAVLAIKRRQIRRHQFLTLSAFASSTLFLVGYLAYHYVHGDTRYPGTGAARGVYLAVLASHVILSIPVVPLCLAAFYYAFQGNFRTHRKITRYLFPMWLYVSVTGVVVFAMLRSAYG
jgi:putative membrane protein